MKLELKSVVIILFTLIMITSFFTKSLLAKSLQAKEAGLVTYVSGKVFFSNDSGKKEEAVSFMKIKTGDVFSLEKNAKLQLVYFLNGRREKWKGEVEVSITEGEGRVSSSQGGQASLESVSISDISSEGLRVIPSFIQKINTERAGSAKVRGDKKAGYKGFDELNRSEKQKVKEARIVYDKLLKLTAADDITPELYSIGILSQYQLYKETLGLVKIALMKQPDNNGLIQMKEMLLIILEK